MLLSEIGSYKSFSMPLKPKSVEWLKVTFQNLIATPRNNRFFQEKRCDEYCLWVDKTSNRRGSIAEIFRIDDRGRKCCIMVPEGYDGRGWDAFLAMLASRETRPQSKTPTQKSHSSSRSSDSNSSDTSRRSYAEALSSKSTADSDSHQSVQEEDLSANKNLANTVEEDTFAWENIVVLSRRFFHDDWASIINKMKELNDYVASYNPFHADKALVYMPNEEQAKLLCMNKGWVTIGGYYVKFEQWSTDKHATPKLTPSYGGWVSFRGVPLHAWNYNTFIQIGNVCGGFIEVAKHTWRKLDIIEASIKIKENYSGFIPASISILDENGVPFTVQTVAPAIGKWLVCRNPKVHGTFSRDAAKKFDEYDVTSESYLFRGNSACPPENVISSDSQLLKGCLSETPGDSEPMIEPKKADTKGKGKQICASPDMNLKFKRKVTFPSPQNQTLFFNPSYAPAKPITPMGQPSQTKSNLNKQTKIMKSSDHMGLEKPEDQI